MSLSLRVFIWNVNSWTPTVRNIVLKYGSIRAYFDDLRADIICLQEVKLPESKLTKELACVEGFESFWSFSRTKQGYSGVATYVRSPFSPLAAEADCLGHSSDSELNCEGRLVVTDHGAFVLFNVYVPNAGDHPQRPRLGFKMSFLEGLRDKMQQYAGQGRQVVLVGDMNIASEQRDVHPTFNFQSCYSPQEVQLLHGMMQDFPDVWRQQHPDAEGCYTVWDEKTSARAFNAGLRIDYVLCSRGLLPQVVSCEIMDTPPKWSDHAGMLLELKDIPAVPKHQPCELSSARMKRFNDRSQKSIFAAFGQKRPAAPAAPAGAASADGRSTAGDAAPASAEDGAAGAPAAGRQAAGAGVASQQANAGAAPGASCAGDAEVQERPHKVPKLAGSSSAGTPAVPSSTHPAAGAEAAEAEAAEGDSAQRKAACTTKAALLEAAEAGQLRQAHADGAASVSANADADPNTKSGITLHLAPASAADDSPGIDGDGQLPLPGGSSAAREQQAGTAGATAAGAGKGRQHARQGKSSTAKKPGAQSEAAGKDGRKQQTLKAFFTKK